MDKRLKKLISEYQAAVREAVELMARSSVPLPVTASDWVENSIPHHGKLNGGVKYFKHGTGCEVELGAGPVDFDFGRLGEIDGFDAWRLGKFAGSNLTNFGFESAEAIDRCFEAAIKSGELIAPSLTLYYVAEADRMLASEVCRDIPGDLLPHYDQDKVVALNIHSFLPADLMRKNYQKLASKLRKNNYLSQNDEFEYRVYFLTWLGYLSETCSKFDTPTMCILLAERRPEAFRELIGQSQELTRLIKLHIKPLKKLRNNVFHTREDVKPILQFATDEMGRISWAGELHSAFAQFFSMYRILCEEHYLTRGRLDESQSRKQHARRKAQRAKQG